MEAIRTDKSLGNTFALIGILCLALFIRLYLFVGTVGTDDVSIADNALRLLSEGPHIPDNHYGARVGLIYPLAALFSLFGVGEWTMSAIPLASSLGGIWLAFLIGNHYGGSRIGIAAGLLLALFPLDAYYATQLMPDLPLGALMALSYYLLLRAGRQADGAAHLAILAGLVWGWAYLVKVEAFFFSFVVLGLLLSRQLSWRNTLLACASVALVVAGEHVVYWLVANDPMLRLHVATVQGGGKTVEAYSAVQLWVFPKAWFLTPYYFGVHYYLLFAALLWAAWTRSGQLLPLLLWAAIFLLWLQFGGNPFSAHYSVKTHLSRYCNMLNVPMAVLIAAFLYRSGKRLLAASVTTAASAAVLVCAVILLPFNQLSSERQTATKQLLDEVRANDLYPLYLDRTSYTLASIYLHKAMEEGKLHNLQEHDFHTMQTTLTPLDEIQGHVLLNHGFVDYGNNRYRIDKVQVSDLADRFEVQSVASNPSSSASYASARLLGWAAQFIPIARFRDKVMETAHGLLEGDDAVLLRPRPPSATE